MGITVCGYYVYSAKLRSLDLYDQRRGCISSTIETGDFKLCRKVQLSNTFHQKKRTLKYHTRSGSYGETKGHPTPPTAPSPGCPQK